MFLSIIVKLSDNMYKGLEVRNLYEFKKKPPGLFKSIYRLFGFSALRLTLGGEACAQLWCDGMFDLLGWSFKTS